MDKTVVLIKNAIKISLAGIINDLTVKLFPIINLLTLLN